MKHWPYVTVLMWIAMAVPSVAELVWTEKEIAFEAKPLQQEIPVVFTCLNKGSKPIRIMTVNSPCNCLHVYAGNEPIAAGEEKALTVMFRPAGRHGKQKLPFKIITDEGGRKEYTLTIRGEVPPTFVIEPSVFVWNKRENLDPRVARVSIAKGVPLKIVEIYSMDENFLTRKIVNQKKGGFDVTVTPQDGDVRRLGRVSVIAADAKGKRYYHHMLMRVVDRETSEFVSEERKNALYWPEELAQLTGKTPSKAKKDPSIPDLSKLKKSLPKPLPVEGTPKAGNPLPTPSKKKSSEKPEPKISR